MASTRFEAPFDIAAHRNMPVAFRLAQIMATRIFSFAIPLYL
jgi:hypothetical protein